MNRFGVNCPWILLGAWSKPQGRVRGRKSATGRAEVSGDWGSTLPGFFSHSLSFSGVFTVLGS